MRRRSDAELTYKLRQVISNSLPETERRAEVANICVVDFADPNQQFLCAKGLTDNQCISYATAVGGTGHSRHGTTCPPNTRPVKP